MLTEVATHWSWLELRRTRFGAEGAADAYLDKAFARVSMRWHPELDPDWDEPVPMDVRVWSDEEDYRPPPVPLKPSIAVKLAMVRPKPRLSVGPVGEAAIAWWHAYEVRRKRKYMIIAGIGVVLLGILAHFSQPPV